MATEELRQATSGDGTTSHDVSPGAGHYTGGKTTWRLKLDRSSVYLNQQTLLELEEEEDHRLTRFIHDNRSS